MKHLFFIIYFTLLISNCFAQNKIKKELQAPRGCKIVTRETGDSVTIIEGYPKIPTETVFYESIDSNWLYVGSTEEKSIFLRKNYISKNYSEIKIWVKMDYSFKTIKGKKYNNVQAKLFYTFNCKTKTIQCEQFAYYNSSGSIIQKNDITFYDPEQVVTPDSLGELMLNKVCELFNN